MIVMRVAVDEKFYILKLEAELLDARADERHGFGKAAVEQDVTLRRRDEIGSHLIRADVINITDDPKGRHRAIP